MNFEYINVKSAHENKCKITQKLDNVAQGKLVKIAFRFLLPLQIYMLNILKLLQIQSFFKLLQKLYLS